MAVYTVLPLNVASAGSHDIVAVYSVVSAIVAVGVAPVSGTVTPVISAILITVMLSGSMRLP